MMAANVEETVAIEDEEPDEIFVSNPHFYVPPEIALVISLHGFTTQ